MLSRGERRGEIAAKSDISNDSEKATTPAVGEVIWLESLQDISMIPILSSGCQLENERLRAAKEEKQAEFARQADPDDEAHPGSAQAARRDARRPEARAR